jgi:hypothetical protein
MQTIKDMKMHLWKKSTKRILKFPCRRHLLQLGRRATTTIEKSSLATRLLLRRSIARALRSQCM